MDFILYVILFIIGLFFAIYIIVKIDSIIRPIDESKNKGQAKNRTTEVQTYEIDKNDRTFIYFNFRVVGIGFAQSTKNACSRASEIHLKAEAHPKDKNAIAVYNQYKERIGYIPKGDKDFLKAFHSYKNNVVTVTNHYYNEEQIPVKYCELDICVIFCGDYEYLKKVISEEPRKEELKWSLAGVRKDIKDLKLSDSEKYNIICDFNKTLLEFNKQAEKVNWVTIPMQETIVLMNKLKMTSQLEYIETHYDFSVHSPTQEKYLTNYIQKHKNSGADKLKKMQ